MTSKAELRAEVERLKQVVVEQKLLASMKKVAAESQKKTEAEAEKARILNEKRANIHKGLIPVDELRKLVRGHGTEFGNGGKLTTITLEVRDHSSLAQDIIDALTKPSYATGGIVSGGYTGVIPPYNDGSWLTRREHGIFYGGQIS